MDVRTDGRPKSDKMLEYIYQNKTSALIEASMMAGAMLAGVDKSEVTLMEKAGRMIGLAFQIRDDILDVIGDEEKLGKQVHSDERNHKITYVTIHGVEASMLEVLRFTREASVLISSLGGDDEFILSLIQYMISRDK